MTDLQKTLDRLNLKLPGPSSPVGAYRPVVLSGKMAFLSGQISKDAEGKVIAGKVGRELTLEAGRRAAQMSALQAVSLIRSEMGLENVEQILRVVGFVQSADNFYSQSDVMNGASELLVEIFGERGKHARTSIGVPSLPLNAAVELELTLKLK